MKFLVVNRLNFHTLFFTNSLLLSCSDLTFQSIFLHFQRNQRVDYVEFRVSNGNEGVSLVLRSNFFGEF